MKHLGHWMMIFFLALMSAGALDDLACCNSSQLGSCLASNFLWLPSEQMAWSLITNSIIPSEIYIPSPSKPPISVL